MYSSTILSQVDKTYAQRNESKINLRINTDGSILFVGFKTSPPDKGKRTKKKVNDKKKSKSSITGRASSSSQKSSNPLEKYESKLESFVKSLGLWKPGVNAICNDTIQTRIAINLFKPTSGKRTHLSNLRPCKINEKNVMKNLKSKLMAADAVSYYIFKTANLGWINCDRFTEESEKLILEINNTEKVKVLAVFKDIKSIIAGKRVSDQNVKFHNIPKGQKITLISFYQQNNKLLLATKEITNHGQSIHLDHYDEVTLEMLKEVVEQLNEDSIQ